MLKVYNFYTKLNHQLNLNAKSDKKILNYCYIYIFMELNRVKMIL